MEYHDRQEIKLGDIVELDMPEGRERAKVVMLGSTYQHLPLEASFESWVKKERILGIESIVVEWIGRNPLAHNDPSYAPVGNYLFTSISDDLKLVSRGSIDINT